jgi:hypothetical protein
MRRYVYTSSYIDAVCIETLIISHSAIGVTSLIVFVEYQLAQRDKEKFTPLLLFTHIILGTAKGQEEKMYPACRL